MSAETRLAALDIGDLIWGYAKRTAQTVGDGANWVGGALQGEFNTQASVGQVVVDAVISMFPIAGEITAARDATAISIRMSQSEAEANNTWNWVSLVLCLLAVVPVFGGVLKGVGRLVMRAANQSEDLVKLGQDILRFLRKMGHGDAYAWFKKLDFAQYQDDVLSAFYRLLDRLGRTVSFLLRRLSGVLPGHVKAWMQQLPPKLQRLRDLGGRMIPKAIHELNKRLNDVREKLVDGSYVAPIHVGAKTSRVPVPEGRLTMKTVDIAGDVAHPPARLSQYKHVQGWPDLEARGKKGKQKDEIDFIDESDYLWPINTFSANGPIRAHTSRPGARLFRILDKTIPENYSVPKYQLDFHRAGDCWSPAFPASGTEFRTLLAVKHGWNANGYFERLVVPTKEQMQKLGIEVPADWQGVRSWRGTVGGQLDVEKKITNGLQNSNNWLPGGGVQDLIDWEHPHNAPVRAYLLKTVQVHATGWTDLQLPVNPNRSAPEVVPLSIDQRSAKIQQEGYVLRGAATASKQSNNRQEK